MSIYWTIFFIASFFSFIENKIPIPREKFVKFFFLFILLIFIGLRFEIGGDWGNYLETYNNQNLEYIFNTVFIFDLGYGLVEIISKSFNLGIYGVNLICALFFLISIHYVSSINKEYWLTIIILLPYLIFVVANGYTRQSVSIGFASIAISYLINNKNTYYQSYYYFIFYSFIATIFHKSAIIIFVFLLPIINVYISIYILFLMFVFFGTITSIYTPEINRIAKQYLEIKYVSNGVLVRLLILMPSVILFYFTYFFKFIKYEIYQIKIFHMFSIITIVLFTYVVFSPLVIIDRFALYLLPISAIIYTKFTEVLNKNSVNYYLYKVLIFVFLSIQLFMWLNYSPHAWYWVPYKNILFNLI